jgi:hypothetical protein
MSDDLDELDAALRRAMAALDGEAPAGYFDALPERTLARLDDPEIGELPGEPGWPRPVEVRPTPPPADVDDAEGGEEDDDAAVFASQIMAAVELPDPAEREASLHRDQAASSSVISVSDVAAVDDMAARAASVPSSAATIGPVKASGGAAVSISAGSPGRRRSRMRAAIVGIGAIGVAAVAAIYLAAGDLGRRDAPLISTTAGPGSTAAVASPDAASGSSVSAVAAGSAASTGAGSAAIAPPDAGLAAQGSGSAAVLEPVVKPSVPPVKRPGKVKLPPKGTSLKLDEELPDGITKGAVGKKLKSGKPRSDRTALSGNDIERAMTAVAGQARACFAGRRGRAALRLTVEPSGRISQVVVIGPYAGTPMGTCVARAVQAATFPVWDGPPQSFDYSYLLSD